MNGQNRHIHKKISRYALKLFFGFDRWHVTPLQERPYAMDVVAYCNRLHNRKYFVEIGCGLGDLVRHVHFDSRVGYDQDLNAIRAARFLSKLERQKRTQFKLFRFPDSSLVDRACVIVMVNWIHHIDPDLLGIQIRKYFTENLEPGGAIIIDTVQDAAYKFNHNVKELTESLCCTVERIGSYERERELWSIIKTT